MSSHILDFPPLRSAWALATRLFKRATSAKFGPKDLTDEIRARIIEEATRQLQQTIDSGHEFFYGEFAIPLGDGKKLRVKHIACADPIIRNDTHVVLITKKDKPGVFRLPGGMTEAKAGVIDSPEETARRETFEETLYIVPPGAEVRVLNPPRVTGHIRIYQSSEDPEGKLAKSHNLKEGDAFITSTVGVDIYVKDEDLSALQIVDKGTPLTEEQIASRRFLRAGDDAQTVSVVSLAEAPKLAAQKKFEGIHHALLMQAITPRINLFELARNFDSVWGYQARLLSALERRRIINHRIADRMRQKSPALNS
jgi:ADP-ribose pyrophosphatase YjhB (NUDIX family)